MDFPEGYVLGYGSMASLHKDPRSKSQVWLCAYRLGDGRRTFRSTGETDKRRAWIKCQAFARIAEEEASGNTSRDLLNEIVNDTLRRLGHSEVESPTIKQWLETWLKTEEGSVAESSSIRYKQVVRDFLAFLGPKANARLNAISSDDIVAFRDELAAGGRSAQTVNGNVRNILKRPFTMALQQGLIGRNPVSAVRAIRGTAVEKGTFTPGQVARLLAVASNDWKGLILLGFYTGARLSDLASLEWRNVDLAEKTITFVQRKTGAKVIVPIHPQLVEYLLAQPSADNPAAPVLPGLYQFAGKGRRGVLSEAFTRLMQRAGVDGGKIREKKGKVGRSLSSLSFHSLRQYRPRIAPAAHRARQRGDERHLYPSRDAGVAQRRFVDRTFAIGGRRRWKSKLTRSG
jgi:integrase